MEKGQTPKRIETEMVCKLFGFKQDDEDESTAQARLLVEAENAINEKGYMRCHLDTDKTFKIGARSKRGIRREGRINGGTLMFDLILGIVFFLIIPAFALDAIYQPWGFTWFIVCAIMITMSLCHIGYYLGKGKCFKCYRKLEREED